MQEYMYRLEDYRQSTYSMIDDNDHYRLPSKAVVVQRQFKVIKHTPKGKWIDYYGKRKFILNVGRKRFALETSELAKESYLARKERQALILQTQLNHVKECIKLAKGNPLVDNYFEFE